MELEIIKTSPADKKKKKKLFRNVLCIIIEIRPSGSLRAVKKTRRDNTLSSDNNCTTARMQSNKWKNYKYIIYGDWSSVNREFDRGLIAKLQ